MNIYTKTGDKGETGLFGGKRVPKTDPRIESYGTIDELNAVIGVVLAGNAEGAVGADCEDTVRATLEQIQAHLMVIASHLATPYNPAEDVPSTLPAFETAWIAGLEEQIDAMEAELPQLTNFILPGGSPVGAQLHVARTVCRRAERAVVALTQTEEIDLGLLQYLNRLSDYLFVAARFDNHKKNIPETPWNT